MVGCRQALLSPSRIVLSLLHISIKLTSTQLFCFVNPSLLMTGNCPFDFWLQVLWAPKEGSSSSLWVFSYLSYWPVSPVHGYQLSECVCACMCVCVSIFIKRATYLCIFLDSNCCSLRFQNKSSNPHMSTWSCSRNEMYILLQKWLMFSHCKPDFCLFWRGGELEEVFLINILLQVLSVELNLYLVQNIPFNSFWDRVNWRISVHPKSFKGLDVQSMAF